MLGLQAFSNIGLTVFLLRIKCFLVSAVLLFLDFGA